MIPETMNNKSNQGCCERSEQTFRPKGEMNTRSHKKSQESKDLYSTIKDLMETQLNTVCEAVRPSLVVIHKSQKFESKTGSSYLFRTYTSTHQSILLKAF